MHRAESRTTFLKCSLGKVVETCFPDPFLCQSKRESDDAAAERSDRSRSPGRPGLAQPSASTARELRQLAPDTETFLPKTKIRLCWLIVTIKYDMQKHARR